MIKTHDFNSRWWGEPVGIVTSSDFFRQAEESRRELLSPYAWVEFKAAEVHHKLHFDIAEAGFAEVDVYLQARLRLTESIAARTSHLKAVFADEQPIELGPHDCKPFLNERFYALPGATPERVTQRYILWANDVIGSNPELSCAIHSSEGVEGWFFATPTQSGLYLNLAMLNRDACASGAEIYRASLGALAARGHRFGHAGYSCRNLAVCDIFSSLSARFSAPQESFLWLSERYRTMSRIAAL